MPVYYKTSDMNIRDYLDPKPPKEFHKKHLVSTWLQKREFPTIEMEIKGPFVMATVKFNFSYITKNKRFNIETQNFTRIIDGSSDEVYKLAARQASRIGLNLERQFNSEWNKTLMQLLNEPSKNKSILNLGVYKKDGYGIYDVTPPYKLLNQKIIESGMKLKDVAILAGVDETTLFRHLKGVSEISREAAIKYARALGCDPSEILFNSLNIPVWASTDTQEMTMLNKFTVYASELIATGKFSNVQCPREIYRPDVKAIIIDQPNSLYHSHVAYYYNSNEVLVLEDQIVIVGTKIKNFHDKETRLRYFIGIYKKNKNGRTIDLHSIDPDVITVAGAIPDEYFNSFDDVVGAVEQERIVQEDIVPEFVAPVVALVNNSKIYNPIKTEILKAYDKIYTKNRKEDFDAADEFKTIKLRAALEGKVAQSLADYHGREEDDYFEQMAIDKVKLLITGDKRFQSILSKAAFGPAKAEKKIQLRYQVKQLDLKLTAEEDKIVRKALDQLDNEYDEPNITPKEAQSA